MHGLDSLPGHVIVHPRGGGTQWTGAPTPEYCRCIRCVAKGSFRHADDRRLSFQDIKEMYARAWPPFTAETDITMDYDACWLDYSASEPYLLPVAHEEKHEMNGT